MGHRLIQILIFIRKKPEGFFFLPGGCSILGTEIAMIEKEG